MIPQNNNDNYRALAAQLKGGDWYKPATGRILFELGVHLTLCFGGLAAMIRCDSLVLKALAAFLSASGCLGILTNGHTASHFATSRSSRLNRFLTYFAYPFMFGTSATYWWHKHCVVHHPTPNIIGVDDDADLMPWFAVTQRDFEDSRGLRRLFFKYQWLAIPLAISVNMFNTQRQSLTYLLPILFDPMRRRVSHWLDLACLAGHWAVWVVLPCLIFGVRPALTVYVLELAMLGCGMFLALAPPHFCPEAVLMDKSVDRQDFMYRQTVTTVNFKTGWFGRLVCAGIEFQIEHHLFPGVPHVYYPKLSPIIKEFCERHGYPYRTVGWAEGAWKSLLLFKNPKPVVGQAVEHAGLFGDVEEAELSWPNLTTVAVEV